MNTANKDVPQDRVGDQKAPEAPPAKRPWQAPKLISYQPVSDTQGISYRIGDGISNLS